jgi:predicted Na+-dependent transporter
MTVGLAPCEIASVATTSMAGGEAAISAGVLIGSTIAAVAVAGPLLSLESGHASVHPTHIVANLALIVALPLAAGIAIRAARPAVVRAERAATTTAVVTVAALVALIAGEVHLSVSYLATAAALAVFLAGSAVVGRLVGLGSSRPVTTAVLLTTSMRDFAIAAGIAASAFGSAAAAPLGLYGVMVLVWGTAVAGKLRRGDAEPAPVRPAG